ncbi:MAG: DUF2693 domain-containing protein [Bacteroidaceae bacterium]|nr:DUF2693 domain-containing protein [Bacteroidaceae bacterium]MBR1449523.1 DUF2693 domain-containing protein [Prevotella sp.]
MSECEQQAQQIAKLCREMKSRIVEFYFIKKDGSVRQAFGTLQDEVILPHIKSESNREPRPDVVTYFDTVAQSFRSFRKENFKSFVA